MLALVLLLAAIPDTPPGARIALVAVDRDGREIIAIRPDERMMPASNTKIFTTAAAFALLETAAPDATGGASVRLDEGDAILVGRGDARLSSAADCVTDCLATLARAVAARARRVHDVVGDDTAFADERWPAGMSWNNIAGRHGTAVSALTLDDNVTTITVAPTRPGAAPTIADDGYYRVQNRALTLAGVSTALAATRLPGTDSLRITGTIRVGDGPVTLTIGIDDPAHRAAWRFAQLLRTAGVRVNGRVTVRHRPPAPGDAVAAPAPVDLARLTPAPLAEDLRVTGKTSQNLHAELLLRRAGHGTVAGGQAAVRAMLATAGIAAHEVDLADGSGMSTYNRVTARAVVRFLRWTQAQSWGAAWRATLPVGGIDGTLAHRFAGTPLSGRILAKTGSLNGTAALSGFLVAASGRTVTFSAIANDLPPDVPATAAIDAAILALAAAN